MIIAAIRSTHSKRRTFQIMPTLFRNSRIIHSRDNSHSWEFSRTYVLSRKDLKTWAGLVFAVEDWRRYRSSSLVNASGCIQKTYRWRTRANPRFLVRFNNRIRNSNLLFICDRGWASLPVLWLSRTLITLFFFWLEQDLCPFLIKNDF